MIRLLEFNVEFNLHKEIQGNDVEKIEVHLDSFYPEKKRISKNIIIMNNGIENRNVFLSNRKIAISQNIDKEAQMDIENYINNIVELIEAIRSEYKYVKGKCELRQTHIVETASEINTFNNIMNRDILNDLEAGIDKLDVYAFSSKIKCGTSTAILNISKDPKGNYINSMISIDKFDNDFNIQWIQNQINLYKDKLEVKILNTLN